MTPKLGVPTYGLGELGMLDSRLKDYGNDVGAARIAEAKDPTGCGDAFRAGLLYGLAHKLDWQTSGQIASLMGAIKIEHHGTQNHHFSKSEFEARYRENFAASLQLA